MISNQCNLKNTPVSQLSAAFCSCFPQATIAASTPRILLVGLGPHAKRIYLHYLKVLGLSKQLFVVAELMSRREESIRFLRTHGFDQAEVVGIPDEERDADRIGDSSCSLLQNTLRAKGITHAIISSEPKAHFAYLQFLIPLGVHILTDKPITSPKNVISESDAARRIVDEYNVLRSLHETSRQSKKVIEVQCQRRYHPGYQLVRRLISEVVEKHKIPPTFIDIYHCDGMWNMPQDFGSRENHPYKYGYGKLFHSGYHFVDLLVWLMRPESFPGRLVPTEVEIHANSFRPSDFLNLMDRDFYAEHFGRSSSATREFPERKTEMARYGELDVYALMQFKERNNVVTTANLTLMQNGFSRRAWADLPEDTYKGNGRVRHERVNIQIGPLMNIQVHSYRSHEIRSQSEGNIDPSDTGGLEHFDIDIYRNRALIEGKEYERVTARDLKLGDEESGYIGHNEQSRLQCLKEFLACKNRTSPLADHAHSIALMYGLYQSLCRRTNGLNPTANFPWISRNTQRRSRYAV